MTIFNGKQIMLAGLKGDKGDKGEKGDKGDRGDLSLGETSSTAYPGDKGLQNYNDIYNITHLDFKGKFEYGNININAYGWNYSDSTSRVRTPEGYTIHLRPGDKIRLKDRFLKMYVGWKTSDGTYKYKGWIDPEYYYVLEEGDYVILLRYTPEEPIESVEDLIDDVEILTYNNNLEYIQNKLDDELIDLKNAIIQQEYSQISGDTGGEPINATNRCCTSIILKYDFDIKVEFEQGYDAAYREFGSNNYADIIYDYGFVLDTVPTNLPIYNFIIPKNKYFELLFSKKDRTTDITVDEVLKHFKFKKLNYKIQKYNYFTDDKIKSINHRGYSDAAPENTLAAFRLSKEMGFNIIECDLRRTADDVIVLLHDTTIDRTSNGTGAIVDLTYEQVLQYDFGSWFNEKYAGEKIPTFDEVLKLCKELNIHVYIDAYLDKFTVMDQAIEIIKKYDMEKNVTFLSQSKTINGYIPSKNSKLRHGVIIYKDQTFADQKKRLFYLVEGQRNEENSLLLDLEYTHPELESYSQYAKENNIDFEMWTINLENYMSNLPDNVVGITSNLINVNEFYRKNENIPQQLSIIENSIVLSGLNSQNVSLNYKAVNKCRFLEVIMETQENKQIISFSGSIYINASSSINLVYSSPLYTSTTSSMLILQYNKSNGLLNLITSSGEVPVTTVITKILVVK